MMHLILCFAVVSVSMLAGMAQAQQNSAVVEDKPPAKNKVEEIEPWLLPSQIPLSRFQAESDAIEAKPFNNPDLAFTVRLPKGWTERETFGLGAYSINREVLGDVAVYDSPPYFDTRATFLVRAAEMPYEISAYDWFWNHTLTAGMNIKNLKIYNDKRLEATYIVYLDGSAYAVRGLVLVSGQNIFLVEYRLPIDKLSDMRDLQFYAIHSFKLSSLPEKNRMERMDGYKMLRALEFEYPASWELTVPRESIYFDINRIRAVLKPLSKSLELHANVNAAAIVIDVIKLSDDVNMQEEIKRKRDEYTDQGYELKQLLSRPDIKMALPAKFNATEIYEIVPKSGNLRAQELWFTAIITDGHLITMSMLSIAKGEDYMVWARNSRAYKLIQESFRKP